MNPLGELIKTPIFAALQGAGLYDFFIWPNDRKDPSCSFELICPLNSGLRDDDGAVAQLVEQRTENPCVGGSIPPHTTKRIERL